MKFLVVLAVLVAAAYADTVIGAKSLSTGPAGTVFADSGAIGKSDFGLVLPTTPLIAPTPLHFGRSFGVYPEDILRARGHYYDGLGRPLYF